MKALTLLLVLLVLPMLAIGDIIFEKSLMLGDSSVVVLDYFDVTDYLSWDSATDSITGISGNIATTLGREGVDWREYKPKTHDTTREYVIGVDTVITFHRVECDTFAIWDTKTNIDTIFIDHLEITCDTVYRVEFRDRWAPKVPVYLDSTQWDRLLILLRDGVPTPFKWNPNYDPDYNLEDNK